MKDNRVNRRVPILDPEAVGRQRNVKRLAAAVHLGREHVLDDQEATFGFDPDEPVPGVPIVFYRRDGQVVVVQVVEVALRTPGNIAAVGGPGRRLVERGRKLASPLRDKETDKEVRRRHGGGREVGGDESVGSFIRDTPEAVASTTASVGLPSPLDRSIGWPCRVTH